MRLFEVAFFSIGLKSRKMRILPKTKTKASLSNPRCPITLFHSSRKSPHIPVLFVREFCIVSLNEDGVCYKTLGNHLWLGKLQCKKSIKHVKMFKNNPVKNIFIFNPLFFVHYQQKITSNCVFFQNPTILTSAKLYVTIIVQIDLTTLKF